MAQALSRIEYVSLPSLPAASSYTNSIVVVSGIPYFSNGSAWFDLSESAGGGFNYGIHLAMSGLTLM